jgi:8-oxo-dGTP pyrophosphatase MutT (NUDIX family)
MTARFHTSFSMRSSRADIRLSSASVGQGVSPDDMHRVEVIWQKLGDEGKLPQFEGTILNALDFTASGEGVTIECGLMRYRCLIARSHENLPTIKPVAVSGFVEKGSADDRLILLGLRSESASTHVGWYETPPSGGLEVADVNSDRSIDVSRRLASELLEETGIERSAVTNWKMFGVFYDEPTGTIDVIFRLSASDTAPRVNSTKEYSELRWVRRTEILPLLKRSDAKIVAVSRWILSQWLSEQ